MDTLLAALLFCLYLSVPVAVFALFVQGRKRRLALGGAAALAAFGALGAILVRTLLM